LAGPPLAVVDDAGDGAQVARCHDGRCCLAGAAMTLERESRDRQRIADELRDPVVELPAQKGGAVGRDVNSGPSNEHADHLPEWVLGASTYRRFCGRRRPAFPASASLPGFPRGVPVPICGSPEAPDSGLALSIRRLRRGQQPEQVLPSAPENHTTRTRPIASKEPRSSAALAHGPASAEGRDPGGNGFRTASVFRPTPTGAVDSSGSGMNGSRGCFRIGDAVASLASRGGPRLPPGPRFQVGWGSFGRTGLDVNDARARVGADVYGPWHRGVCGGHGACGRRRRGEAAACTG
jgi:hypothetical protein